MASVSKIEKPAHTFPPITYSTAYDLKEEIHQYLKTSGISLVDEDGGRVLIEKQPVDSIYRPALFNYKNNANAMKNSCRKDDHSLLKFLALNALELAAPASDILLRQQHSLQLQQQSALQQQQQDANNTSVKEVELNASVRKASATAVTVTSQTTQIPNTPKHWFQLSGHPDCFAPAGPGTIWKKCSGGTEAIVYEALSREVALRDIVPRFLREVEYRGETFIELQDLLHQFHDPHVMDIKMGTRTFLESEVQNTFAREDLYLKMIAVDPSAPTAEENEAKKVTKLRYMQFREEQSSTSTLGFRIEAMKFRGSKPVTDLKKTKSIKEVLDTLSLFLANREDTRLRLLARLADLRMKLEQSHYFKTHEVVGSSILIIYDDFTVGAWLIDFAKTRPVPPNTSVTHRLPWSPGNHEDGFLYGLDQLIMIMENVHIPASTDVSVPEKSQPSFVLIS